VFQNKILLNQYKERGKRMNILKTALIAGLFAGAAVAQTTIYSAGLGGSVTTGGWWYANAESGDGSGNDYTCNGDASTWGGLGSDDKPTDFAASCETASGMDVTFDIVHSSDGANSWGYGLIGFDFVEQAAGTADANKEPYDITTAGPLCVTYTSTAAMSILVKTTDDKDGDAYGVKVVPSASPTEECASWGDLGKAAWSADWTFNPANATGLQFKVEKEGSVTVQISKVTLGGTPGGTAVLFNSAANNVKFSLAGKNLSFKTSQKLNVEVFDVQGRLVANGAVSKRSNALSLNSLSQGTYIVRALGEGVNLQQKIAIVE